MKIRGKNMKKQYKAITPLAQISQDKTVRKGEVIELDSTSPTARSLVMRRMIVELPDAPKTVEKKEVKPVETKTETAQQEQEQQVEKSEQVEPEKPKRTRSTTTKTE